jgi:hypothetical protein
MTIADTLNQEQNYKKVIFGTIEYGEFCKERHMFNIAIVQKIDSIVMVPVEKISELKKYCQENNHSDYFVVGSMEVYYDLDAVINHVKRIHTL